MAITQLLNDCRKFFDSGATKPYSFRRQQLLRLKTAIQKYEPQIYAALHTDLKKSPEECWVTENGIVLAEINHLLGHLKEWMQPERKRTNLLNIGSASYVYKEPLGVVLIIGPWNYPFQLMVKPLAGAIAAGNAVVLKPSEYAPATSAILKTIVKEIFSPEQVLYVEGEGSEVIPAMMNSFAFDHVFFTGSTAVGKAIYKMAAQNLTPVTLELGGKSPAIVEEDANIKVAAKRIALPKFSNAGQMCIAPDYVLVHHSKKDELLVAFKESLIQFFGKDALQSDNYGKIINEKQFGRLVDLMAEGKIVMGGNLDKNNLYIEPTIITEVNTNSAIMQQEIFGPLLPVISFETQEEALSIIAQHKNPLAFYLFTCNKKKEQDWLNKVAFGGGCINNASLHFTNDHLPFGGRGNSGMGMYHGKYSFDTFSHQKAVMKTPTWLDPAIKYPPFTGKLKLFKWFVR